jgi:antitoxin VapB
MEIMPGPIQIKRPEVAGDIRTLASLMGVSITDAIANAVRGQLAIERVKGDAKLRKRRKDAEKALTELRNLPVIGPDISDKDLYDEHGFPK